MYIRCCHPLERTVDCDRIKPRLRSQHDALFLSSRRLSPSSLLAATCRSRGDDRLIIALVTSKLGERMGLSHPVNQHQYFILYRNGLTSSKWIWSNKMFCNGRFLPTESSFVVSSTFVFAVTALATGKYCRAFGPFKLAPAVTTLNSKVYAVVSLFLFFGILASTQSPKADRISRYAYHISKFYEYVDIINVLASGGSINLHFAFHHLTTPYFTLFRVVPEPPASRGWQLFAALNAFHHALLYGYLGGWTAVKDVLPWTQHLQLLAGIAGEAWFACADGVEPWRNVFAGGLLACYLVLYHRMRRLDAQAEAEQEALNESEARKDL